MNDNKRVEEMAPESQWEQLGKYWNTNDEKYDINDKWYQSSVEWVWDTLK